MPDSKKRITVLLSNALVLPGLGHILVKRYYSGTAIALSFTAAAVYVIAKFMVAYYYFITGLGLTGSIGTKPFLPSLWGAASFRWAVYIAVLLWAAAVADSFRITKEK